jgi:hypothetical protein
MIFGKTAPLDLSNWIAKRQKVFDEANAEKKRLLKVASEKYSL